MNANDLQDDKIVYYNGKKACIALIECIPSTPKFRISTSDGYKFATLEEVFLPSDHVKTVSELFTPSKALLAGMKSVIVNDEIHALLNSSWRNMCAAENNAELYHTEREKFYALTAELMKAIVMLNNVKVNGIHFLAQPKPA